MFTNINTYSIISNTLMFLYRYHWYLKGAENGVMWLSKNYTLSYKDPVHPDQYAIIRTLFDDLIDELGWKYDEKRFVQNIPLVFASSNGRFPRSIMRVDTKFVLGAIAIEFESEKKRSSCERKSGS